MDTIFKECKRINDVFETEYINKSIIICNNPGVMYHLNTILQSQLYPVDILSHLQFKQTLDKFMKGNLRMLIMSDVMYQVLHKKWTEMFDDVQFIFLSGETLMPHYFYSSQKNIISLSL